MTKYDQKRPGQYNERRRSITAAETAAREAAREKQRQRLREAQAKANATATGKYRNRKTTRMIDGETVEFDSEREARRWDELRLLERAGKISNLKRQVRYRLIPTQRDMQGNVVERACDYIADFVYCEEREGKHPLHVVEDAKGVRTEAYKIKRKLMFQKYGVRIREV